MKDLLYFSEAIDYSHEPPFYGFKRSGLGREGAKEGIGEYTEVKSIVLRFWTMPS